MDKIKFHPTFFFLIECLTLLCHIMEVNWAAKAVSCSLIIMTAIFLKVSRNLILRLYFRLTTLYEEKICSLYLHFPDQWNFLISFFFAMIFTLVYTPPKFYSDPVPQQAVCGGHLNVVSLFTKHDKWSNLTLYAHGQKICIVLPFLNDFFFFLGQIIPCQLFVNSWVFSPMNGMVY